MDDQFQVVLLSNSSSKVFPNNSPNDFSVKLPSTCFLEGDYEVALFDIQYPYPANNFLENVPLGLVTAGSSYKRRSPEDEFDNSIYNQMEIKNTIDIRELRVIDQYQRHILLKDEQPIPSIISDTCEGGLMPLNIISGLSQFNLNDIKRAQDKLKTGDNLTDQELTAFEIPSNDKKAFAWPWNYVRKEMPAGYYQSIEQFCTVLNNLIFEAQKQMFCDKKDQVIPFEFKYDNVIDKIKIVNGPIMPLAIFTPNAYLALVLGMNIGNKNTEKDTVMVLKKGIIATNPPMLRVPQAMFIYTDIIKYQTVGDIAVPLLAVIPVRGTREQTGTWSCSTPYFIPLTKSEFDTVRIRICTATGDPYPIGRGITICHLRFRRKRLV